jgi:hypothetical protein
MTRISKKDYIKTVVNLRVVVASIGIDQWRGLPSTPPLDPAETPHSNLPIHIMQ